MTAHSGPSEATTEALPAALDEGVNGARVLAAVPFLQLNAELLRKEL